MGRGWSAPAAVVVVVAGRTAVVGVVEAGGGAVELGDVSCEVGVTGGGSLKMTSGLALVVGVAGATEVVVAAGVPVERAGAVVVVVRGVVGTAATGDDVDVGWATLVGGVAVVGTKRLVGMEPSWARAASPVAGLDGLRVTAANSSPATTTATITPSTVLARTSWLAVDHQPRRRLLAPGRPKAAFLPIDRPKASRTRLRPGGARARCGRGRPAASSSRR